MDSTDEAFLLPRRCFREPVPEIFHAAHLLDRAIAASLARDHQSAEQLIKSANIPAVRAWTESLWGNAKDNPDQWKYIRLRQIDDAPVHAPKSRGKLKTEVQRLTVSSWGRNCAFCGIPLIREEVRTAIRAVYPLALPWGGANAEQHTAFQCMWLQYDHIVPHSRGGDDSPGNIVATCAPCNFGRNHYTLAEVGLHNPRDFPIYKTSWDGLERFLI